MIQLNGAPKVLEALEDPAGLVTVVEALGLKTDRVAVERNGEIVRRGAWEATEVRAGDRLEIVHFVGGGAG
jgi:sulfur carrier protein